MKNILYPVIFLLVIGGCVSAPALPLSQPLKPVGFVKESFSGINPGMTRADVAVLLDGEAIVGFKINSVTGVFEPVRSRTLISSEILTVQGVDYQVDMYLPRAGADIATNRDMSVGEAYPVIYRDGILTGQGLAELKALRARGVVNQAQ